MYNKSAMCICQLTCGSKSKTPHIWFVRCVREEKNNKSLHVQKRYTDSARANGEEQRLETATVKAKTITRDPGFFSLINCNIYLVFFASFLLKHFKAVTPAHLRYLWDGKARIYSFYRVFLRHFACIHSFVCFLFELMILMIARSNYDDIYDVS